MSISARPIQWNKKHAPHSRTFRNEWIQSSNYKNCKWVNNSQQVSPSVTQLWKKHFWKGVQFLKVWLFREKIHFIISDNANQHSVQSWDTHRHHETIMYTWKSQEVGSSRCSSNFVQHMQVRIFAVTLIIPRKTYGTPQYLLPNARVVP
jgi:hypothetical protein